MADQSSKRRGWRVRLEKWSKTQSTAWFNEGYGKTAADGVVVDRLSPEQGQN